MQQGSPVASQQTDTTTTTMSTLSSPQEVAHSLTPSTSEESQFSNPGTPEEASVEVPVALLQESVLAAEAHLASATNAAVQLYWMREISRRQRALEAISQGRAPGPEARVRFAAVRRFCSGLCEQAPDCVMTLCKYVPQILLVSLLTLVITAWGLPHPKA